MKLEATLILMTITLSEGINYDENKAPNYTLPDPLMLRDGTKVTDADTWTKRRRTEILKLFEENVYSKMPGRLKETTFEVTSIEKESLGGKAERKEVSVYFTGKKEWTKMDILIYLPKGIKRPTPVFLGPNFYGNHSIHKDPKITLSKQWMRNSEDLGIENNRAIEESRGVSASRWPVECVLARGYALATVYYGDLDPDFDDGFQNGIHPLFYKEGQTQPAEDEWGSIGAWAWGLSRAMDYFETDEEIDHRRVAVIGHSRLGKTTLWADGKQFRAIRVSGPNLIEGKQFERTVAMIDISDRASDALRMNLLPAKNPSNYVGAESAGITHGARKSRQIGWNGSTP